MGDERGENTIALPPDADDEFERRAQYERHVAARLHEMRVADDARHRLAVERHGHAGSVPLELLTLRERLTRPRLPTTWRIRDWQPAGSRVVLAAQFKSGKTTLVDNLVRCLVDGDHWLGRHEVTPVTGTVAVLDFEMGADQLDDWLRDQRIRAADRVLVVPMRGRSAAFDLLDERVLAQWADLLRRHGVAYVVVDCLRPILDALGLDEQRDAGRFLVALDRLLTDAGVDDALVVHHMGHTGERSRGDSRIRDWPDVEWRLVRETDEPASPRYVSAYGRDVDQHETQLAYIADTRRLTLAGGSRVEQKSRRALADVTAALDEAGEPLTGRAVEMVLAGSEHSRDAIRGALKLGIRLGSIEANPGPRRSTLHSRPASAPVRGSAPPVRQRSEGECASALIESARAHTTTETASARAPMTLVDDHVPDCPDCSWPADSQAHEDACQIDPTSHEETA
jgi:AAA domain